ncbi:hypothetical protein ACF0H5_013508 [Mactra antiquata]
MKMTHCRSPSDPGPPKGFTKTEASGSTYNDAEKQFFIWLHSVGVKFLGLSDSQKARMLDTLISLCGSKEMLYLSDLLPSLLYRDFLRLLPTEISVRILMMLDEKSLLNCCLVSKYWNHLINSFREVWIHMAKRVGARILAEPYVPIHKYKSLFIQSTYLVQQMKNKSAFELMTLEGHRGRVMAITYNKDIVATGSDDHTVRFWDIENGDCTKVIHTHSVSALQFDDIYVYTASFDNTAACWDIDTGQLMCRYVGHISAVFSLDARRDVNILVTGSADKTVKIWQVDTGVLLSSLSDWHNDWITHVKILSCAPNPLHLPDVGIMLDRTLQIVSVDRHGCCFWTVKSDDHVDVSVTHTADWCMNVPLSTECNGVSVCTWNKKDKSQSLSTYNTETVDGKCIPRHMSSWILPLDLPVKQTVLGIGQKFAIFMVDEGYSRAVVIDIHTCRIMCTIPVPPFR